MTTKVESKRGRGRWVWLSLGVLVISCMIGLAVAVATGGSRVGGATPARATTRVVRGSVVSTVLGNGTINAAQSLDLAFQTSGTVTEVKVKEGDVVKRTQVLAQLDDRDLKLQVENARISLQSAQARLKQLEEGNATPEDLAAARASLNGAQANLTKTVTGNVTKADIDSAKASVANAEAQLRKAINGSATAADISSAQAQVRSAQADLNELLAGPKPAEASSAQAKVDQAEANLRQVRSSASSAKTQAESDLNIAANAVREAQDALNVVYHDTHQGDGAWKKGPDDPGYQDDVNRYNEAVRTEEDARAKMEQARITLENAKTQEIADVASAESQLRDAEAQLKVVMQGATPAEIAKARASRDQAQANLDNLRTGGTKADIDAARANVAQAKANLNKLYEGGTRADIAASQANVEQSEANFAKLTAPATLTDKEIQQASIAQAEQSIKQAELKLESATLRAPFDGVVTLVGVVPGSSASTAGTAFQLIDRSTLYVELKLSENDVAKVQINQPVTVTIDALEDWSTTGMISYISPVAEDSNGVVTYKVKVSFPDNEPRVRIGMTANLSIVTATKTNVLLVPNTALLPKGSGRAVQVPDGAGVREVDITTGLSDETYTEILSGLQENDAIISVPSNSPPPSGGLFGR